MNNIFFHFVLHQAIQINSAKASQQSKPLPNFAFTSLSIQLIRDGGTS